MKFETLDTARQIVNIIPLVMRIVAAEVRRNPGIHEPSHIGLLGMLAKHNCTMSDLADKMSVSLPTMSKSIRRLEESNWVRLLRSDEDRRVVWAELTPDGRAVLSEVYEQTAHHVEELVRQLSPPDHDTLRNGLTVLRDLFETHYQSSAFSHQTKAQPEIQKD